MHHRSSTHSKQSNPLELLTSKSLEPKDQADIKVEREYLSKLRTQRERIQKLYLNYQQSLATINSLTQENAQLKERIVSLQGRLTIEKDYKQLRCQAESLVSSNNELGQENQQLRLKYEEAFVENNRKFKQLKQYYNEQLQELSLENGMLKDLNKNLESKLEELKMQVSTQRIELAENDKIIERIKRQHTSVVHRNKQDISQFQAMISERDEHIKKLRLETTALKDKNLQQSYFIELEKQKTEELIEEYNKSIAELKLQVQQLEAELLSQLQQNNICMSNQEKYVQSARQAKTRLQQVQNELQSLRASQTQNRQRREFLHKQQVKKLEERAELLEQQVKISNKDFTMLVSKYERLQQLMKRRELNQNAKRQLISYEHQEIDKMDLVLKL